MNKPANSTNASPRHQSNAELAEGIGNISTESGGVLDVYIVDNARGADLSIASLLGDDKAAAILQAVVQTMDLIRRAPRGKPILCVSCPKPITRISPSTVFGVAMASISNPSASIGFCFCAGCGSDSNTLMTKATSAFSRLWPKSRAIQVTHDGGHA
jgi:hypothetical protein